jgi:hypothetical protein
MSNTNKQTEGAWGLYPWFEEHGAQLVHSEDLGEFRKLSPYGKVFLRTGEEDGFIRLAYGERTFRVKPDLFRPVAPVSFPIGTRVTIRGKDVEAVVDSIQWHQRDAKPIYYLRRDGKLDSRRYSADDLSAAVTAP